MNQPKIVVIKQGVVYLKLFIHQPIVVVAVVVITMKMIIKKIENYFVIVIKQKGSQIGVINLSRMKYK